MKLKVFTKAFNDFTEIDKFIVVPKKIWNDIEIGEQALNIKGTAIKVRIYDIPCDCTGAMHSHRLIDLRNVWDKLKLQDKEEVEVKK